jgi:hypothetical protein
MSKHTLKTEAGIERGEMWASKGKSFVQLPDLIFQPALSKLKQGSERGELWT